MTDLAPTYTPTEIDPAGLPARTSAPLIGTQPASPQFTEQLTPLFTPEFSPDLSDPKTAADIASLDDLWNHDWDAPSERSVSPQRVAVIAQPSTTSRVVSRSIDLIVAVLALLILLPIMIVVAVTVRLSSPGGAIFTHARMGRNGESFGVLKFRSMSAGVNHAAGPDEFKLSADDPRITPVGRFIRKTSLDELPQLFNVIKGDMSIVGIRPMEADEVSLRPVQDQQIYRSRRPGMTGLWQVEGRSNIVDDQRIMLDRTYVQEWSVASDMVILVRTPLALFRAVGAF